MSAEVPTRHAGGVRHEGYPTEMASLQSRLRAELPALQDHDFKVPAAAYYASAKSP